MENKTIVPEEHYAKLKEIDAKIRIVINDMVNQFGVEIDSSRNDVINVVNIKTTHWLLKTKSFPITSTLKRVTNHVFIKTQTKRSSLSTG